MKRIIIMLSAFLAALICLSGCFFNFSVGMDYSYNSTGFEKLEENTVKTFDKTVQKVDMDWISGRINFVKGDTFSVSEKMIKGDHFPLYYKLEAGTLYIKWAENGMSAKLFEKKAKELTVTVTEEFAAVTINNVSAEVNIGLYSADKIDIDTVSGDVAVKADEIKEIKLNGVSAQISIDAKLTGAVNVNTVSGKAVVNQKAAAKNSYKFDTVSGSVELTLPSDTAGYKAKVSTVSGSFSSDFGDKEFGDGSIPIDFNSVSANLKLKKAD